MSQGVYVLGGKCPGGKCPGGMCPWGMCPGVHVRGGYVLEPVQAHLHKHSKHNGRPDLCLNCNPG